jgi:macrolide-specific efflux system membrane fusion protein
MKRGHWMLGVLLLGLSAGGWVLSKAKSLRQERNGQRTVTVTEGAIEQTVEATGSVSPLNRVEIKPPISGRIEKLLAKEGDSVEVGQILAQMSSSDRAAILDAARAQGPEELKRWEDSYKPTPIVAPLSGVIILRNAVVGQTVDPGNILFAMSDTLVVLAQVDESDIGQVKAKMPARITLDAFPKQTIMGMVFDILYEGKNVSNVITYGVKIRPEKTPIHFRSQMTANVSFIVQSKSRAVLIPPSVVRELPNGKKEVLVLGPGGTPIQREITTGIESNETLEVLSGLRVGEQVIVTRGKYLPQQGPQASPLTFGGKPSSGSGKAPRPRKS